MKSGSLKDIPLLYFCLHVDGNFSDIQSLKLMKLLVILNSVMFICVIGIKTDPMYCRSMSNPFLL